MPSNVVHLVTFSDESMSRAADLCVTSAGRNDISGYCVIECPATVRVIGHNQPALLHLLDTAPRGVGFWSWKSLVIDNALNALPLNDYLVYADAGVEFIDNVNHIISRMDQDIFLFGNNWEHAHWCKADVISEVMPTWYHLGIPFKQADGSMVKSMTPWPAFGKQVQASVIFFRVSDYTRRFVKEWLEWCLFEGGRLIDDSPSRLPNHPEFREHRHDQAILTTMAYREGIKLHYWPAVYNRGGSPEFVYEKLPEYAGDGYPVLFSHHRRRDWEWPK